MLNSERCNESNFQPPTSGSIHHGLRIGAARLVESGRRVPLSESDIVDWAHCARYVAGFSASERAGLVFTAHKRQTVGQWGWIGG